MAELREAHLRCLPAISAMNTGSKVSVAKMMGILIEMGLLAREPCAAVLIGGTS